jgi:hypothetical protein
MISPATPQQIDGREIVQIAFHVNDLARAALHWARCFGAGPFFVYEHVAVSDVRGPDGEPAVFDQGAAFGQWGTLMVELVKMHQIEPDPVASIMLRPGFHHIAYFAADSAAEVARLESQGARVLTSLGFGGVRVHFHDALATSGFVIEHYPCVDAVEEVYRKVAEAAVGWDGTKPVRGPFGS